MVAMPNPPISTRLRKEGLPGSPIRRIMELADRENIINMGLDPDDVISFAGGWVNHAAPDELRSAYTSIVSDHDSFHTAGAYSPTAGLPQLRELLVAMDQVLYSTEGLEAANILVGANSTQLTYCLFLALLDPGDHVLLFDPTYANYPPQLEFCHNGVDILTLPVLDTEDWSYFASPDEILERLEDVLKRDKPKLLLFSSPDNPTGGIMPDSTFFEIIELAYHHGCFVAVDYAYRAQYFTEKQPAQFAASPIVHPNLIKIHSNSKWCRGLGRRLGWIEARADVIDTLEAVQQSVVLCPDTVHQMALASYLESALPDGSLLTYMDNSRAAYKTAAQHLTNYVDEFLKMRHIVPQGGLYTVVDVGREADNFVYDMLEKTGVIFVPGSGFGRTLKNGIRISFGPLVNDLNRMKQGFERVRNYLDLENNPGP
jgi:aspartate/methionine/tyrosine aminotransferase|tara:strand:+ start:1765 stop:3048 length:1284 start_codon:yes stop_codon:yes gene_type:complete